MPQTDIKELNFLATSAPEKMVLDAERTYFDKIEKIASQIINNPQLKLILLAGPSGSGNAEVARIMDILKQTDMSFTEFDDVTVRRLVECIQVCGNHKIIVTLKGGYQAEEELRKIEAA